MTTTTCGLGLDRILRGHEGERFYSPIFGTGRLDRVGGGIFPIVMMTDSDETYSFDRNGCHTLDDGAECLLFPSTENRDWGAWAAERTADPWRADPWAMYYYIDFSTFKAMFEVDRYDTACLLHYELGNYFRTREEAEAKIAEISEILRPSKNSRDDG